MMACAPASLIHKVWEYPLVDALFGRRSRRFELHFEMTVGPFKYKSRREPLPLSELEELCSLPQVWDFLEWRFEQGEM